MDKICRDKRKEVHARLDFRETSKKSRRVKEGSQNSSVGTLTARAHSTDLAIPIRQAQLSPTRTWPTLGIVLTVEVVPANRTLLLAEIILEAETASAASKNHMYVRDNEVPVINSGASSVPTDAFMMIYDDMCEPVSLTVLVKLASFT
nr:hypothetical protein [Tanacetum cinerariifolium]